MADRMTDEELRVLIQRGATLRMTTANGSTFEGALAYISMEGTELWYRFASSEGGFQNMEIMQRIDDPLAPSITLWVSYGWRAEITPIADPKWDKDLALWRDYVNRERRAGRSVWPSNDPIPLPEGIRYEV